MAGKLLTLGQHKTNNNFEQCWLWLTKYKMLNNEKSMLKLIFRNESSKKALKGHKP